MPKDPERRPGEEESASEADVDEESEESFPASDPPSHWSGGAPPGGAH
jgi:hypothetical protein